MTSIDRASRTVLVPEAHALGAIGVIRSLGRAGYQVVAISSEPSALGLRSSFASRSAIAPPYEAPEYIPWLREFIAAHGVDLIIPSEGFLLAIRSAFATLEPLLPVASDADTVYRAFSKVAVAEALLGLESDPGWRGMLPPTLIVQACAPLPSDEAIARLGGPYYVKSDASLNSRQNSALLHRCLTVDEVRQVLSLKLETFETILVQGFVPGVKAAVAYCLDEQGSVVTRSGVLGIRTTPHHGGMMTLREAWSHPRMEEIGLAWLRHLAWRGVAMVECKWDPESDRFWLIEINARYWGYLHLDLYAGVDVPRLQADRYFGWPREEPPTPRLGVRCRHAFPGDAGWLLSRLKDPTVLWPAKIGSCLRFLADFADVRCRADLYFPADRNLYWIEAGRYFRSLLQGLLRRIRWLHNNTPPHEPHPQQAGRKQE